MPFLEVKEVESERMRSREWRGGWTESTANVSCTTSGADQIIYFAELRK
jgi:hypothetical protein